MKKYPKVLIIIVNYLKGNFDTIKNSEIVLKIIRIYRAFSRYIIFKVKHSKRASLAKRYLKGYGVEIGALHLPLILPKGAHVKHIDRMSVNKLRQQYPELKTYPLVDIDIIDDGEKLEKIKSESQDFVIANHFLEHCENPIGAIETSLRVLKKGGGYYYLTIPDKRFTFDINRPTTKLKHLLKDYTGGAASSREEHYREWAYFVDKKSGEDLERHVEKLMNSGYSIHFHVWTWVEMFELMMYIKRELSFDFDIEEFVFDGNECIFILKKSGSDYNNINKA